MDWYAKVRLMKLELYAELLLSKYAAEGAAQLADVRARLLDKADNDELVAQKLDQLFVIYIQRVKQIIGR